MKTIVRSMGCREIRSEIEEAGQGEPLSPGVSSHLKACRQCQTFYDAQFNLRQIVSSLSTVAAPNDFEFRLRARLAGEKRGAGSRFTMAKMSFGLRATAFATLLLLMGSALWVVSLRPTTSEPLIANSTGSGAKDNSSQPLGSAAALAPVTNDGNGPPPPLAVAAHKDQPDKADLSSSLKATGSQSRGNRPRRLDQAALAGDRVRTRDMSSTAAKVLKPEELVAAGHSVFPIYAQPQALRVSLDNGRGSSKTISVPGVSFGSQRVATQNPSPLLASTRGAW